MREWLGLHETIQIFAIRWNPIHWAQLIHSLAAPFDARKQMFAIVCDYSYFLLGAWAFMGISLWMKCPKKMSKNDRNRKHTATWFECGQKWWNHIPCSHWKRELCARKMESNDSFHLAFSSVLSLRSALQDEFMFAIISLHSSYKYVRVSAARLMSASRSTVTYVNREEKNITDWVSEFHLRNSRFAWNNFEI